MYGVVTVQRAKAKTAGGFEILPFETSLKLINGKATITEAETDGTGPFYDSVYLFRVQNGYCGRRYGFMAALPDGTTPITTGELPMVDPITGEGIYMDAQEWNALYGDLPNRVSGLEGRVETLEALGGLAPESPIDGQTANLIEQDGTLTATAIEARIDSRGTASLVLAPQGTNHTQLIQDAIIEASSRGADLRLNGVFNIAAPIIVDHDIAIVGGVCNVMGDYAGFDVRTDSFSFSGELNGTLGTSPSTLLNQIGILASESTTLNVLDAKITNFHRAGVWANYSQVTIRDTVFQNYGYCAITLNSATRGIIDSCKLYGSGNYPEGYLYCYGVAISSGSTEAPSQDVTVSNCYIENQKWEALDTHGGKNIMFLGNIMSNCERGIVATQVGTATDSYPERCVISGNIIIADPTTVTNNAIAVSGASTGSPRATAIVENNFIRGYGDKTATTLSVSALTIQACSKAIVTANVIENSYACAIRLRYCTVATVQGNVIDEITRQTGMVENSSRAIMLQQSGAYRIASNLVKSSTAFTSIMGEGSVACTNVDNDFQGMPAVGVAASRTLAYSAADPISVWAGLFEPRVVNSGMGYPEAGTVVTSSRGNDRSFQLLIGNSGSIRVRVGDSGENYGKWAAWKNVSGVA